MKRLLPLLFVILYLACSTEAPKKKAGVQHHGSLQQIMQHELDATVDLDTLNDKENLYAVGALEGLKGEIMILNGDPFISKGSDSGLVVGHSFDYKATLLVQARVEAWESYAVPDSITSKDQLERFLPEMADDHGLDTTEAFPFLLEGKSRSFRFHVVNWKEGDREHSHEKHKKSGPYGLINHQEVEILGFYSNKHHGQFTHHDTNLHMHVKTPYKNICGHLDDLTLGEGMSLKLPKLPSGE